ncbi:MAG: septum formation protein Maf [Chloroflexi bacterium]|nr:septum formation protein Maf [Chloroflexota bacterium]
MKLILASNSPRRRQLLALLGWDFQIVPAEVDESTREGEPPSDYVRRLAASKARAVSTKIASDAVIIAADTTVVDGDEILGKPVDRFDAERMLRQLRGRNHQVLSALAVNREAEKVLRVDSCITDVPMRNYDDAEMQAYIASGDPMDKAGAYAIQHAGFHPAEELTGCYANVVGLPLCHLTRTLRKMGIVSDVHTPTICQATLGYICPIFEPVLQETL